MAVTLLALPVGGPPAQAAVPRTTPFALLKQLVVLNETTTTAPNSFGAWSKPTAKKCKTLQAQVLTADAVGATPKNCSTAGLSWVDPLTGATVKDVRKMSVVRLVPLEEAWDSGASRWDAKTRTAFANDLGYDGSLVAVSKTGATKRKDREPSAWIPATKLQCDYATRWMTVKVRWRLTVDTAEYQALRHIMGVSKCDRRSVPGVKLSNAPAPVLPPTRYQTCAAAAAAGVGPYVRGRDSEYSWYRDDDGDGTACESSEAVGLNSSSDWRTERLTNSTQPTIYGDVPASAGPRYLHARVLRDGAPLWTGVSKSWAENTPARLYVAVPAGVVTTEGTYTAQIWNGGLDDTNPPADAVSLTFRLDVTPPPIPESDGSSAWSDAPDVAALLFSSISGSERVPVRQGQRVVWRPPGPITEPLLVEVRAQDHAGNVGPTTSYGVYS